MFDRAGIVFGKTGFDVFGETGVIAVRVRFTDKDINKKRCYVLETQSAFAKATA